MSLVLSSALTPSLARRSRSVALRGETAEKPGLLAGGGGGGGPEAACCMDIGDERPVDGVYGEYWEELLVRKEAELTVDWEDSVDRVLVRVWEDRSANVGACADILSSFEENQQWVIWNRVPCHEEIWN